MPSAAQQFSDFLETHGPVAVISGAGISTASGIPDYRDRNGNWKNANPVQYQEFRNREATRQRYWARSYGGWKNISSAQPNAAHQALVELESQGNLGVLVTQNVDCLHSRAGHRNVIDLHGRLDEVICLDCQHSLSRQEWQAILAASNPDWDVSIDYYKPDGDAELAQADIEDFVVPACPVCGGTVKPDVVFFGENVPRDRLSRAVDSVSQCSALVVIGSSLMVFSGFRFARLANEAGKPILILNDGVTRADELATVKIEADCTQVLGEMIRNGNG